MKDDEIICSSCLSQFEEILRKETCGRIKVKATQNIKSAQQQVLVLSLARDNTNYLIEYNEVSDLGYRLMDACERSSGRLVLRIWKGGARWWNLNSNSKDACLQLANAEVAGYRVAREAFHLYHTKVGRGHFQDFPRISIPEVLLFKKGGGYANPWAIFSYVKDMNIISEGASSHDWKFCDDFIHSMVKIRKEFGFDEPHPRHGRVCVEHALEYAEHVLENAIIPLHTIFFDRESNDDSFNYIIRQEIHVLNANNFRCSGGAISYHDMVQLYQENIYQIKKKHKFDRQSKTEKICVFITAIEGFIDKLVLEAKSVEDFPLPSVVCHLDLQPQNMILCTSKNVPSSIPRITSILDWEESCYADPRFELLLLCRKVVANRKQADTLWGYYSKYLSDQFHLKVGPIDPWLRLESVHSLLGMCMQGMDLLEGGRNPWEEKSDLLNKMQCEIYRLQRGLNWGAG